MPLAVFDIDGTLTNTTHVDEECYTEAIREELDLHMPADWATLDEITDAGILHHLCERQALDIGLEDEQRIAARLSTLLSAAFDEAPERFQPVHGAQDIFEILRNAGWNVAMATGCWRSSALFKLQSAGIPHEGVPLATSSEHRKRREIIRMAVSLADEDPSESVVYFGDGVWDGRAARDVGCFFIGVGRAGRIPDLTAAGAEAVVEDFGDVGHILDILERLDGRTQRGPLKT